MNKLMLKSGSTSPIQRFIIEGVAEVDPFAICVVKKTRQTQQFKHRC